MMDEMVRLQEVEQEFREEMFRLYGTQHAGFITDVVLQLRTWWDWSLDNRYQRAALKAMVAQLVTERLAYQLGIERPV
jgi:hypothetical protein